MARATNGKKNDCRKNWATLRLSSQRAHNILSVCMKVSSSFSSYIHKHGVLIIIFYTAEEGRRGCRNAMELYFFCFTSIGLLSLPDSETSPTQKTHRVQRRPFLLLATWIVYVYAIREEDILHRHSLSFLFKSSSLITINVGRGTFIEEKCKIYINHAWHINWG